MVPIGRRWPCAEGFCWPGTLLLVGIFVIFRLLIHATWIFEKVWNTGSLSTRICGYKLYFSCIILTFSVHVMLKQVRHSECDKTVGALLLQMRVQYWIFIAWLTSINLLFFRIDVFLLSKHFKSIWYSSPSFNYPKEKSLASRTLKWPVG